MGLGWPEPQLELPTPTRGVERSEGASDVFRSFVRRSYEVVGLERVAGLRDNIKTLHTIHFAWGFAADESVAGTLVRETCRSVPEAWSHWHDDS